MRGGILTEFTELTKWTECLFLFFVILSLSKDQFSWFPSFPNSIADLRQQSCADNGVPKWSLGTRGEKAHNRSHIGPMQSHPSHS